MSNTYKTQYKSQVMQEIFNSDLNGNQNIIQPQENTENRAKTALTIEHVSISRTDISSYSILEGDLLQNAALFTCSIINLVSIIKAERALLAFIDDFEVIKYDQDQKDASWTFYGYYLAPLSNHIWSPRNS